MMQRKLISLLTRDPVRMQILRQVSTLASPDCWVAAGFARSLVWDHLHHRTRSPLPEDIDVIWFDPEHAEQQADHRLENALKRMNSHLRWSVKNQARMHVRNGDAPYQSATDAMTYWPETATAVAVRINGQDEIEIAAPLGLEDLFSLMVRPTPRFEGDKYPVFLDRIRAKEWETVWPGLMVLAGRHDTR
ncbi:nucleotidyltransferase family protein [Pseudomonas petrae]|uniref:Nucleotidyltransferase family protein n=1 Tax=Pseudomonas petrae TaxID=2912190 RepID=A0ABS9I977_9PSED|nr:nucleotidyltransferase family protein [Pseudomonas petrae]MCF7539631.1 nucleotidyltransferase family protein [Pseudomonas petrae]MCF7543914.1 nucleotidyltransferase family protein [Pseudomonas petrae]MCF7558080.1 nucleotidyltransferase family protein [Pseudomonas petrae]